MYIKWANIIYTTMKKLCAQLGVTITFKIRNLRFGFKYAIFGTSNMLHQNISTMVHHTDHLKYSEVLKTGL